jgi:hypothetical protein
LHTLSERELLERERESERARERERGRHVHGKSGREGCGGDKILYICTHTRTHTHTRARAHTHTHTHTHTQDTCKLPLVSSANMSHKFWSSKTTKTFIALLDNYEREVFFFICKFHEKKLAFKKNLKKLVFSKNCFPHPSVPRPAFLSSITMSARCFVFFTCAYLCFFFRPSSRRPL